MGFRWGLLAVFAIMLTSFALAEETSEPPVKLLNVLVDNEPNCPDGVSIRDVILYPDENFYICGEVFVKESMGGGIVVQEDFELICFDIVSEPSTPNAYVYPKEQGRMYENKINEAKQNIVDDLFKKILED